VEKHSMDKLASRKVERKYQQQIGKLAEELQEVRSRLKAKDGTLRVLEKQIRGKSVFIDELRRRIEDLVRQKNELQEAKDTAAASASRSASETSILGSNNSTFCPTPSFASSPVPPAPGVKLSTPSKNGLDTGKLSTGASAATPTRQTMRRSSGVGAGSIVRSACTTSDTANNATAPILAPKTPPPFRSPSPSSRVTPRSLQRNYLPQTSTSTCTHAPGAGTAQRDPSEGGIETQLTPSTRSNFLLMEQKKTIESLTRALVNKTEECVKMEKEFEQYKIVVAQETKRAYFLSPKDLSLVTKGPMNAESVLCDSDEFSMESHNGDARDDAPTRPTTTSTTKNNDNGGDDDSAVSNQFLNRLDNIGIDLSMDIADLSALIDGADSATSFDAANGEI